MDYDEFRQEMADEYARPSAERTGQSPRRTRGLLTPAEARMVEAGFWPGPWAIERAAAVSGIILPTMAQATAPFEPVPAAPRPPQVIKPVRSTPEPLTINIAIDPMPAPAPAATVMSEPWTASPRAPRLLLWLAAAIVAGPILWLGLVSWLVVMGGGGA